MRCDVALYEPPSPLFTLFLHVMHKRTVLLYFSLPPLTISFCLFIWISSTLVIRRSSLACHTYSPFLRWILGFTRRVAK